MGCTFTICAEAWPPARTRAISDAHATASLPILSENFMNTPWFKGYRINPPWTLLSRQKDEPRVLFAGLYIAQNGICALSLAEAYLPARAP